MNALEFADATFRTYIFSGNRSIKYRIISTEDALRLAILPLVFDDSSEEYPPSPEEAKIELENLLDTARQIIVWQAVEPKFILSGVPNEGELLIDILMERKKTDPEYGKELLGLYMDIVNNSGVVLQRPLYEAESDRREFFSLACASFGVDPTAARSWPASRTTMLLEDYTHLLSANTKARKAGSNK